jgi:hypothetical protein
MSHLAKLVLVWMVHLQDPNGWGITPEWAASYPETAQEIADEAEANPLLHDAKQTASLLTEWSFHESHFNRDAVGDGGGSLGLMQVGRFWGDSSMRKALALMHESFRVCAKRPLAERAAWYAAGGSGCDRRLGLSRSRMLAAKALAEVR